eukprot:jgi/Bigna1/89390/estExt_fgenesh1_pg.C_480112
MVSLHSSDAQTSTPTRPSRWNQTLNAHPSRRARGGGMGRENDEKDQANILTPAEEKKGTGSADSGSSNTAGGAAVIEVYDDAPKASMVAVKIVAARALFTVAKGDASNTSVKVLSPPPPLFPPTPSSSNSTRHGSSRGKRLREAPNRADDLCECTSAAVSARGGSRRSCQVCQTPGDDDGNSKRIRMFVRDAKYERDNAKMAAIDKCTENQTEVREEDILKAFKDLDIDDDDVGVLLTVLRAEDTGHRILNAVSPSTTLRLHISCHLSGELTNAKEEIALHLCEVEKAAKFLEEGDEVELVAASGAESRLVHESLHPGLRGIVQKVELSGRGGGGEGGAEGGGGRGGGSSRGKEASKIHVHFEGKGVYMIPFQFLRHVPDGFELLSIRKFARVIIIELDVKDIDLTGQFIVYRIASDDEKSESLARCEMSFLEILGSKSNSAFVLRTTDDRIGGSVVVHSIEALGGTSHLEAKACNGTTLCARECKSSSVFMPFVSHDRSLDTEEANVFGYDDRIWE